MLKNHSIFLILTAKPYEYSIVFDKKKQEERRKILSLLLVLAPLARESVDKAGQSQT